MKKITLFVITFLTLVSAKAQFSIGTDLSLVRATGETNSFWALAQAVQPGIAVTHRSSFYLSVGYTSPHKTDVLVEAPWRASTPTPPPAPLRYVITTEWRVRQFSLGYKVYFKGSSDAEEGMNVYGLAGVGFMSVKGTSESSRDLDTINYKTVYPLPGEGSNEKLSFDVGLGIERPLGGNFFWYVESKAWIPTADFSSPYLPYREKLTPVMIGAGLRVLFGHY